jgi:hypothetical protein
MKATLHSLLILTSLSINALAQNLLSNASFEAGNNGFTSSYTYSASDTYPERTYSVVRNPHDTHSGAASYGDHTTSTGFMLVANGSSNPSDAVWRQTVMVQPNRNYTFSGFASSWGHNPGSDEDPNPPVMLIFINGQQQTAGVQVPRKNGQWQNFTAVWSSGSATQATIEIRLGSTATSGNDISLDDLSFRLLATGSGLVQGTAYPAIEISWPSVAGKQYQPQWSPDMSAANWFDLGLPVAGTGGEVSVFDKTRTGPKRFYRILAIE